MPYPGDSTYPGTVTEPGRTFGDLITEALGSDFSSSTFPGTNASTYVNEGVHRVTRKVRIPTLETVEAVSTVAGTDTFSLPTDDIRVVELFNSDDREPLEEVRQEALDDAPVSSGKPFAWARYGGSVTLYPTPDQTYSLTLRYLRRATFSSTADTTTGVGFPDDYADLLVSWARHRLFRMEDDWDASNFWRGEFERQLGELKDDMGRQSNRKRQLPSMWEYQAGPPGFVRP